MNTQNDPNDKNEKTAPDKLEQTGYIEPELLESSQEDGITIEKYNDGSVVKRCPKTGCFLPGTINRFAHNNRGFTYPGIAGKIRDRKTLEKLIQMLYNIANTTRDERLRKDTIMDIAKLEGWLNGKQELDVNVNSGNMTNLQELVNKTFGLKNE